VTAKASTAGTGRVLERRRAVALARHYREFEGLSIRQIADRLSRSPATVKAYFYDPTGEKARAVKSRYVGVCRGCGAYTKPRSGKGDPPTRTARTATLARSSGAGPASACRLRCGSGASATADCRLHTTGRARTHAGERERRSSDWPVERGRRPASLAACSGVGRPLGWQRSETRTRPQGIGRPPRRRDRSHKRFVCLIQRNPPQNPRVREEVGCRPNRAICRDFPRSTRCLHVIRVGEVPGSNPGAPIFPCKCVSRTLREGPCRRVLI
jgi:hypothetical protein